MGTSDTVLAPVINSILEPDCICFWVKFTEEIFLAMTEEETRLRRDEMQKQRVENYLKEGDWTSV